MEQLQASKCSLQRVAQKMELTVRKLSNRLLYRIAYSETFNGIFHDDFSIGL